MIRTYFNFLIFKNKSHGSYKFNLKNDIPDLKTPWEWCTQSLIADKDTRQAVLRFSLPEHFWTGNLDFTCCLHGLFSIRDDKLNFTINIRKNKITTLSCIS